MADRSDRLTLIDGSGYIFRAYHALPPLTRSDGTPVGAVRGFVTMLLKLLDDLDDGHTAVIFDAGRITFRNEIYDQYKAQRPDPPEDLIPQFGLIRDATKAFSLPCIEQKGYEADDLIATYARQAKAAGKEVLIVSADKDLMQLVEPGIAMLDPMKSRSIGPDQVMEKFGVTPDKVIDVQALAGDSVDNVPGVPGIGVKTAAQLINDYGDLETLLSRAEEIKQPKRRENLIEHADMARISKELVTLKDDVPVDVPLEELTYEGPDGESLLAFVKEQEFKTLAVKVAQDLGVEDVDGDGIVSPDEAVAAIKDAKYELVQTEADLDRWIAEAFKSGFVAVDTETNSLRQREADLVGVCLSVEPGTGCYIPLRHKSAPPQGELDLGGDAAATDDPEQIPFDVAIAKLKPLLEDPGVLKIGHNIKYDLHVLERAGINVSPIDDTMVLSYVLDGSKHGHGMDELAEHHFGLKTIKFKDVCGSGKNQITFDYVDLDTARDYAAEDADITRRLHVKLKMQLLDDKLVTIYEAFDRPLVNVLQMMEANGIKVDVEVLSGLSKDFAARAAALETEAHELAGREFNVASPKQLGEILFDEMSLPGGKKSTKTGAYSTGADVLEDLAAQGHDLPVKVLEFRQLSKLKSTYTDALMNEINPETGRVHTNFSQTIASTGRLSSNEPNLQNIPIRTEEGRKIRTAFIAEPGHKLISADYSQIELRLVAHVADIKALKQAFHDGADIHAITASQMFDVPVEDMDPMIRRRAKAINFGIIYGISAFGLSRQLSIPRDEARDYINAYFEQFPEIQTYMERTKEEAKQNGFVRTLYGRKCQTPGINDKNPNMRGFAERAAINAPIQGGAADIIKRAMIQLPHALYEAGLSAKMLLQVHDELIFEVPDAEVEATQALVKQVMENAAHLSVPLVVDSGVGDTWADAH